MSLRSKQLFIFLFFTIISYAAIGCGPLLTAEIPAAAVVLPTQAAVAILPTASLSPEEEGIQPTWTPVADELEGHGFLLESGTPWPTATATPVQVFPTRTPTPIPPTATPEATNTPEAYVPLPLRLPEFPDTSNLGPSKLGLHVIQNNDPRIMEFVRNAQPAVVKAVGDLGFLSEVKEASPRTITIGRVDDIYIQNYIGEPEEAAREYVEKHIDTYLANPGVDYWEGWNEPDPNVNNMRWYAAYEAERVRLMAQYGLKSAIGGFPTGVPEMYEFRLFLPAIQEAKAYDGILTLHEYGAPTINYLYGSGLPGYEGVADRGALTFRYRWFYEEILIPMDLVIPLAITEAGIDGIIGNRPGPGGLGWRDFGTYWVEQGWGKDGTDSYINQLAWYDAGVRQDGYVIGFAVFSAGASGISHWKTYDINPILPDLTNYVQGQN